ncbi:hypothetical protein GGR50DRAFT_613414 [Xylaria sp. CBS 124048]|nr:hypothetical protein GGR50DRAFT_613414 [Xylaria sp. CBS 124048]
MSILSVQSSRPLHALGIKRRRRRKKKKKKKKNHIPILMLLSRLIPKRPGGSCLAQESEPETKRRRAGPYYHLFIIFPVGVAQGLLYPYISRQVSFPSRVLSFFFFVHREIPRDKTSRRQSKAPLPLAHTHTHTHTYISKPGTAEPSRDSRILEITGVSPIGGKPW